ncbi:Flp pilus assembly protein CpaB, partial [Salmonella enterica subsp. enterica serovar Thompson]
ATPKIAEQIAVAQTLGSLSLSLRSIADNSSELEQAIASGDVSMPDDPKAEKAMLTRIASTPATGGGTMVTGADVSRFQRSTVPGKPADTSAPGGAPGTGTFPGAATGPVIRVARGNAVTDVALGGKK